MALVNWVKISPLDPERFRDILQERYGVFEDAIEEGKKLFENRMVFNVNSTARGGGVAEMLQSLIAYANGAGVRARWLVIGGNPDFFRVTKRLHNRLHGVAGDGGDLDDAERRVYESTLEDNGAELAELISDRDVVILHDPQTAGLIEPLKAKAAAVIWRCHVGLDTPNDEARAAWEFLRPYVTKADAQVFSRKAFVWEDLDEERAEIIPPSIDAFSPKNQDLEHDTIDAILAAAGLIEYNGTASPTFCRVDGSESQVDTPAVIYEAERLPIDSRLVVQVSRWDRLKDPLGVIQGFADHIGPSSDAALVLAGPDVERVTDDPEGAEVLQECRDLRDDLPGDLARRVYLVSLPMEDAEENAAIVNALQRRADVVVQKSIAEGFGLTVAEAMWKARPVVASRVGGIQEQIEDGVNGFLVDDARDLEAYGKAVVEALADADRAEAIGTAARERVTEMFLGPRHLMQYLNLLARLLR